MESNSFYQRLSKSKSALILLVIVLISSIIVTNLLGGYMVSEFGPGVYVEAIELDEKPTEYIPYIMLEPYGIQSIFTSNTSLKIRYNVFIGINELMDNYPNEVVEYDNQYYRLTYDFEVDNTNQSEPFAFALLLVSSIFGFIFFISVLLLIVIVIVKIGNYFGR